MVGHFQAKHSVHTTTTFVILLFVYITSCTPYMQTTWPQGVTRTPVVHHICKPILRHGHKE